MLKRAAVLCRDGVIRPEDLPAGIVESLESPVLGQAVGGQTLREVEERHIRAVLDSVGGNRTQAAKILGIGAATLWRLREE
ncbi:MAG: helix-turn-helix domain-containing protein [Thermoguttaceae bacterium]